MVGGVIFVLVFVRYFPCGDCSFYIIFHITFICFEINLLPICILNRHSLKYTSTTLLRI